MTKLSEERLMTGHPSWGTAAVIGGSYSGLVAARVLADFFREVIVIDRDPFDQNTGTHPGAPQAFHAHALLAKGGEILERLFPGLREELSEAGAPIFDYGQGIDLLLPTGFAPRKATGVKIQTFTRGELERCLRRRVLSRPEVRRLPSTTCTGLTWSSTGRANGISCHSQESGHFEVSADFIVDASGRSSSMENWLRSTGIIVPPAQTVRAKITYASTSFTRPQQSDSDHSDSYVAYEMLSAPNTSRAGILLAVENNQWACSLFAFQEQPPNDSTGYLEFAESLKHPRLAKQITRDTKEPIHRYTSIGNHWKSYHAIKDWPDRLIAIGDAVCAFNPVYGQGLTVAALEAEFLQKILSEQSRRNGLNAISREFQKGLKKILTGPWRLSTGSDLMWSPESKPLASRLANWYNSRVLHISTTDASVWSKFVRVVNMVDSPSLLFHPMVILKVLTHRK
ncbi:FAD-dependent oxidoreductase [Streptomyces sp. NPDC060085]|uniref:FAD-dependent oxidoreductase n=1 Tax=Streptomyces sp. NPDC060085 TaxID=3347054 RepID=UPI003668AFBC